MSYEPLRHDRRTKLSVLLLLPLLAAGCGNRLPREEIVAAAGGGAAAGQDTLGGAVAGAGSRTGVAGQAGGTSGFGAVGSGGSASGPGAKAGSTGVVGRIGAGGPATGQGGGGASGLGTRGAGASTSAGSTILLGNVGTYSGPIGAAVAPARTAVQVWAAATNARGGLGGHPVQVISADDQGDPAKARAIVQDMVENKKVVAFIGNQTGTTGEAVAPYLEQKRVPAVGGSGTAIWNQSPMYFNQGASINIITLAIASTATLIGKKKIASLYCAEAQVCSDANDILRNGAAGQGASVVYSARISLAQPDFTAECISARNAGADAMTTVADAGTVNRVAAACARQGYRPQFIQIASSVDDEQQSNANLQGMFTTQGWFGWATTTGAAADYQAALKRYAPNAVKGSSSASGWGAGQLFARALKNVGAGPVTSDMVLKGLWSLKRETIGGLAPELSFSEGKPGTSAPCYFIQQIQQGRWTVLDSGKVRCLR